MKRVQLLLGITIFGVICISDILAQRNTIDVNITVSQNRVNAPPKKISQFPIYGPLVSVDQDLFGTIKVGGVGMNPMTVFFDTGSPWTWVNSNKCPNCDIYGMAPGFDCSKSPTCKSMGIQVKYSYGVAVTQCELIKETVTLEDDQHQVTGFVMGMGIGGSGMDYMKGKNGVLGLGYPKVANQQTFLHALKDQKQIDELVYGVDIDHDSGISTIKFGGIDKSKIDTTKPWYSFNIDDDSNDWTTFGLSSVTYKDQNILNKNVNSVIFDTGISTLQLDTKSFNKLLNYLIADGLNCQIALGFMYCLVSDDVAGGYDLTTKEGTIQMANEVFGTLSFTISKQTISIEGEYYVYSCRPTSPYMCYLSISYSEQEADQNSVLLGDPLFAKYYVVFYEDTGSVMVFNWLDPETQGYRRNSKGNVRRVD